MGNIIMTALVRHDFNLTAKPQQADNIENYLNQRGFIHKRHDRLFNIYPVGDSVFTLQDAQNLEQVVERYSGMGGVSKRIAKALEAEKPKP